MIEDILAYTSTYLTSQQKENRKQKGQFFTTENIAKFMAAKSSCKADHLFILDNENTLKRLSITFDIKEENPSLYDAQIKIQDEPDDVIIIENQIYDPCKKRVIHHTIEDPREIKNDEDLHEIEDETDKDH